MHPELGIAGHPAPDFRFDDWLANVDPDQGLHLDEVDEPVIYLYNFQAWCPGCHSHGFPTLVAVKDHFEHTGRGDQVKFIAVQTVFEGHDTNSAVAALESVERHGLTDIVLGHDSGHPPTIMADYRTGGTPWTVVIGPDRTVLTDGFQADATDVIDLIEITLANTTDHPETDDSDEEENMSTSNTLPTPGDIRERLTAEQYQVTQNGGTERAFTGKYWETKDPGVYECVVCGSDLFERDAKYDSGTGWPSFSEAIAADRIARIEDQSHGMVRTEAQCAKCNAHLGHIFTDGPGLAGERFCMNSASLDLAPASRESGELDSERAGIEIA